MKKEGKFFGVLSLLDICVIIIVIFLALSAAFKNMRFTKDVEFNIYIDKIHPEIANSIGYDNIYSQDRRQKIGKIIAIEISDAYGYIIKDNGERVLAQIPDQKSVVLKIRGKGSFSGLGLTIGGDTDQKGSEIAFYSDNFRLKGVYR